MEQNNNDFSDQLNNIQDLLRDREHDLKSRNQNQDSDVFSTLLTKVLEVKEQPKQTDVPAYLQLLIAALVLLLSVGGSWVGMQVQTATMQQEIKQLQKHDEDDKNVHKEVSEMKWDIRNLKSDVNDLKKR